jgi:hypothetical protein
LSDRTKFILLFLFLLAFRTAFGLSGSFWSEDEKQTYLIGLKWFCTHQWPYFGPDLIVTETGFQVQIPGALEGLLVGTPLFILPIPEAPYIFLNILSLAAIALMAWYITRRLPEFPFYFVFAWIALLPWNLNESTWVLNPSYLLLGSVLFFIGFMEAIPGLTINFLTAPWAFALMGFGLFWNMQFHFSWILMPPFVLLAFALRLPPFEKGGWGGIRRCLGGFAVGALPPATFLIPTLLKYGFTPMAGGAGMSQPLNFQNMLAFPVILVRYLSLACYEMPRFAGHGTTERLDLLKQAPWLAPPGLFLLVVGWVQPVAMLLLGWKKDFHHPDSQPVYKMAWGTLLLIGISFWFTSKEPQAHIYYVTLPVVLVFSFYIWSRLALQSRFWVNFGKWCLAASFVFQWGFMVHMIPRRSLYTNRSQAVKAIEEKNYHLMGERRPGSLY